MNKKQSLFGALLIAAGTALLLSNMHVEPVRSILAEWWPMFIVAFGALMWWTNPSNYAWSLIVIAAGLFGLSNTLHIVDVQIGDVILPAIFVFLGLGVVLNAVRWKGSASTKEHEDITAVMSEISSSITTQNYAGGRAAAYLGSVEIDLTKATIKDKATLHVSVLMGSIELRVPEGVAINNQTVAIMGSVEDKNRPAKYDTKNPVLHLTGTVTMGSVEIKR